MGSMHAVVFVVAALLVCNYVSVASSQSGHCPPANKVYNDKPRCFSDADCQKWGKLCCPNQHNTKSCADRAPWSSKMGSGDKYSSGGGAGGVMCDGVKCRPYEVCKPDPFSKRRRCQRP